MCAPVRTCGIVRGSVVDIGGFANFVGGMSSFEVIVGFLFALFFGVVGDQTSVNGDLLAGGTHFNNYLVFEGVDDSPSVALELASNYNHNFPLQFIL